MSTEQMRGSFEFWWAEGNVGYQFRSGWEALRSSTGDGYNDEDIDREWEAWKAAWSASRAALVVTLPDDPFYPDGDIDCPLAVNLDDVKSACIGVGINLIVGGEK
ncbi:hypothetical protein R9X49_06500 [Pectobacterium carotovorum]|uniref:hypothetical protein n=1 Tax=Pectobacterium carotovorum TaxID=554 RepID=UPI0029D6931E|nr:hypothetical protein [Pectobacterium carotovorum]MDX6914756.1 hypothetical protein [Pectobacterium carotovorum]